MLESLPLWAIFGLASAVFSAIQMLWQERFKTSALPMALWSKAACVFVMLPFVVIFGLPPKPIFYILLILQSLLWVVSDVIFYRGVNDVGAGAVARVLPTAPLIGFFLWLAIDRPLLHEYVLNPLHSVEVIMVIFASTFCAWHMDNAIVTCKTLRKIWIVLVANIIGFLSAKIITQYADMRQGVFAYVFFESIIMIAMWMIYYALKKPLAPAIMFNPTAIKTGLVVGSVAAFAVATKIAAIYSVDNPAYVSVVRYLDAVIIFFFYRVVRHSNQGYFRAALGMIVCAVLLIAIEMQPALLPSH